MDIITIVGVFGSATLLFAFLMNQTGRWSSDCLLYDIMNVIGAGLLVIYAYLISSYPFMILNIVWFGSAVYDVVKYQKTADTRSTVLN